MKVLMLAQSIDTTRGPDGFIADWVRVLATKVDELTVLTYHYNPQEKLPPNTRVFLISGNNFLTRNFDLFLKTFQLAKNSDVIFLHILEIFGIVGGIVGKITGKKSFLWYCQGYNLSKHNTAKLAMFLVNKIFTSTDKIKKRYINEIGEWINRKIIVVGHGIYLPRYD